MLTMLSHRPSIRAGLTGMMLLFHPASIFSALAPRGVVASSASSVNNDIDRKLMMDGIDYEWWRTNHPIQFSEGYGDYMVLQRAPESASVTGHLGTVECPTDASKRPMVVVSIHKDKEDYDAHPSPAIYAIDAEVYPETNLGNKYCSFRATFPPTKAGGSYTFEARYMVSTPDRTAIIRHVTFGDVWYCSGQSNMALSLRYTMNGHKSLEKIQQGGEYDNIRIYGLKSNMNVYQPWVKVTDAVEQDTFSRYSATCYYFAEKLTDELKESEGSAPAIGLVHTAWGGSPIEDWVDDDTLESCSDVCLEQSKGQVNHFDRRGYSLFMWNTLPYVNMTIKGWIWYQGENNMGWQSPCKLGNSERNQGYSCLLVGLVRLWRNLWSATPGTTNPNAPFGVVALPYSGSEGNRQMGLMRWAQTGSYGTLPNSALPNTFLAQTYDIDEPYRALYDLCFNTGCCYPAKTLSYPYHDPPECTDSQHQKDKYGGFTCSMCDDLCGDFCESAIATNWWMGTIHSRLKYPVGSRLAVAAARSVYHVASRSDVGRASTGPTLAGCAVEATAVKIWFNSTLLAGDTVFVQDYDRTKPYRSKMEVLLRTANSDNNGLCLQIIGNQCVDDGHGNEFKWRGYLDKDLISMWQSVDILTQGNGTNGGFEVVVDLGSFSANDVMAIRYAWEGTCCWSERETENTLERRSRYCPPKSCPIYSEPSGLPANSFLAEIVDGRCKCISPQVCDGDGTLPPVGRPGIGSRIKNIRLVPSLSPSPSLAKWLGSTIIIIGMSALSVLGLVACSNRRRGQSNIVEKADETEMIELVW